MTTNYICTVQIVLDESIKSGVQACDAMSGLLSENSLIKDWGYCTVVNPPRDYQPSSFMQPRIPRAYPSIIGLPNDYQEGDYIAEGITIQIEARG